MKDHLEHRIKRLVDEHAAIDKRIDGLEKTGVFDDATIEVLKLHIKDEIVKLRLKLADEAGESKD